MALKYAILLALTSVAAKTYWWKYAGKVRYDIYVTRDITHSLPFHV
jgi:hypothetical protein